MINIDIYTDFVCPFCYIGKTELENAIKKLDRKENINISYKAFELNPYAKKTPGTSYMEHIYERFPSKDVAENEVIKPLIQRGENLGLDISFYNLDESNTFDCHRLLKYAKKEKRDKEFLDISFKKVFEENAFLADEKVLLDIGRLSGLDEKRVKEILNSDEFSNEVREDENKARMLGVSGVPFFVFNDKYALSGAQSEDTFISALEKVMEENKLENLGDDSNICGFDGCK